MQLTSTAPFGSARLKLIWANKNIDKLEAEWEAFLQTDFCTVSVEDKPKGGQLIRVTATEVIPAEFAMLTGDIVHGLKSALDHTISELMGWRNTRITFPMAETREELERTFLADGKPGCAACGRGSRKGGNTPIEEAVPGIGEFILDEVRPYKAGNSLLWILNKLDNRDKHRLLVPLLVPSSISDLRACDANGNSISGDAHVGAGGRVDFFGGTGKIEIQSYGKATAEIFFHEVGIIEGQPMLPTLVQMTQLVSQAISSIEKFARVVGWQNPAH